MRLLYNKVQQLLMIVVLFFSFSLIPTFSHIAIADAAGEISAFNTFAVNAWGPDWGYKRFVYKSDYMADLTTDSKNKITKNHDWFAYKCPTDGVYAPECGNGAVVLNKVHVVNNKTGEWLSYLKSSSFTNGSYSSHPRIYCGKAITLGGYKKSADELKASKSLPLRNGAETTFLLDGNWAPSTFSGHYAWSNSY